MYRLYLFVCYLFFFSTTLFAQEVAPWFGNVYEFQPTLSYQHLAGGKVAGRRHLNGDLVKASLLFTPHPDWSTQLELYAGRTVDHRASLDAGLFTVRYSLSNDIVGDFVSVTSGLSLAQNSTHFLHDLLFVRHGRHELEAHVAIGKEFELDPTHYIHLWAAAFYGIANHSAPWIRSEFHIDTQIRDTHLLGLFLQTDKGCGHHSLHRPHHFRGYSHIHYNLVDVGATYQYSLIGYGSIFTTLKKRLHARSCPKELISIEVGLEIPFSF